jgi:hypothetical protein
MFSPFRHSVFRGSVFRGSVFRGLVFRGSVIRGSVTVSSHLHKIVSQVLFDSFLFYQLYKDPLTPIDLIHSNTVRQILR